MIGKRKNVPDDAPALVDIMEGLMTEMRAAFAAGDAVAVDRIYDQMVRQMDAGATVQVPQPVATNLP
jgi:hypothetical protein